MSHEFHLYGFFFKFVESVHPIETIYRKFYQVQRGWIQGLFSRGRQQEQSTLFSKFKARLPSFSTRIPGLAYALESGFRTVRIFKPFTQRFIGWLTILEDHLPDVGVSLSVIGAFLFFMGYTLILRDNWVLSLENTTCRHCLDDKNEFKKADRPQDEILAKKDVDLAVPIFRFVKVFPFHKKFSGTTNFSLNSVKMKLIIQFNRATQTA